MSIVAFIVGIVQKSIIENIQKYAIILLLYLLKFLEKGRLTRWS